LPDRRFASQEAEEMKPSSIAKFPLILVLLACAFVATPVALAQSPERSETATPAPSAEQVAWLAKAKADYPLRTCVVSGEGLSGGMGGPVDYVYREEGKPDRLIRFCCRTCLRDFKRSPERFLKKLDAAFAARAAHSELAN